MELISCGRIRFMPIHWKIKRITQGGMNILSGVFRRLKP